MTEKLVFKSWKNMALSCHISVIFLKKVKLSQNVGLRFFSSFFKLFISHYSDTAIFWGFQNSESAGSVTQQSQVNIFKIINNVFLLLMRDNQFKKYIKGGIFLNIFCIKQVFKTKSFDFPVVLTVRIFELSILTSLQNLSIFDTNISPKSLHTNISPKSIHIRY